MSVDTNWLRRSSRQYGPSGYGGVVREAADEIDALRAELDRLRALHACEVERRAAAEGREKAYLDEVGRVRAILAMAQEFTVGRSSGRRVRVVRRQAGLWWKVVDPDSGYELNNKGWWEYKPDKASRAVHTLDAALAAARALVEPEEKACKACSGSGVEDDGRHGGIADFTPCPACNGTGVREMDGAVERCECGEKGYPMHEVQHAGK